MKTYLLIAVLFIAQLGFSQQKDDDKMNKDLKVAQAVLESLIKDSQRNWGAKSEKNAQYIKDYGVVLTLPTYGVYFRNLNIPPPPPMPDISDAIQKGLESAEKVEIMIEDKELEEEERDEIREQRMAELEERKAEIEKRAEEVYLRVRGAMDNLDSIQIVKQEERVDEIKEFLLEYGNLISQLDPSEKVLVIEGSPRFKFLAESQQINRIKKGQLSVEITYGDILDYQSGKITREEAESRIRVNSGKENNSVGKDLSLFQSILDRLYQEDLSESYFLKSKINVQYIDGLGAIYYMDMASSKRSGNNLWDVPTQQKSNLNQEDRDELVKGMYQDFEQGLIANLLEYGEKINSLKDDEQVIIKSSITKCDGCGIPSTLELQINAKVLKQLNNGDMNTKQAKKEVVISKGNLQ